LQIKPEVDREKREIDHVPAGDTRTAWGDREKTKKNKTHAEKEVKKREEGTALNQEGPVGWI